jgi:hypothetical protein
VLIGFVLLLVGGVIMTAGITGSTLGSVVKGAPDRVSGGTTAGLAAAPSSAAAGGGGSTPSGTPGQGGGGSQAQFGTYFAQYTGLDPSVVHAWLLHEQAPGSPATPGSSNWLNIGYTDAGPNASYWGIAKLPAKAAARASAAWLKINQPSIAASAGQSPQAQAQAIIDSGWASSHYGYPSPQAWLNV